MDKLWKILVTLGIMMLLSAVGLCVYNYRESEEAYKKSQTALEGLKEIIPEKKNQTFEEKEIQREKEFEIMAGDDIFKEYDIEHGIAEESEEVESVDYEMPVLQLDSRWYCGYVTLPTLNIELPVLDGWSYENLKTAPCRYEGSPETNDFIIIAHNYSGHFGQIDYLHEGDEIIFTDCDGTKYEYTVSYTEYIDGYDIEEMSCKDKSEWDLTLFTCTFSGQSRVTVRAKRYED